MSAVVDARQSLVCRALRVDEPGLGQIGSWHLTRLVSGGRLCRVYQATPAEGAARPPAYALKVLAPEYELDPQAVACICREAEVGREVTHPHLVTALSAHTQEAPYYLVMPWLSGTTLAACLKSGPLMPSTACWVARQTAEALDALHQAGWVHADVKPDNILLSPQRHATLLDLGFAHRRDEAAREEGGCLLGTISYMAPETFDVHHAGDVRSDIYSLGVTLFEMLAGRVPFAGRNAAEIIRQHRGARPDNLRSLLPHLPRQATALLGQMLAKEPLRRPQTPREVIDQLVRLELSLLADR
jgi:serine/threonine-protein kinase